MGRYLNPFFDTSAPDVSSEEISLLTRTVAYTNASLNTVRNLTCVTAPHGFGKTRAAQQLAAYYSRGKSQNVPFLSLTMTQGIRQFLQARCLSERPFADLFHQCDVLFWNMRDFVTKFSHQAVAQLQNSLLQDIHKAFPSNPAAAQDNLPSELLTAAEIQKRRFFVIIDDWDAPYRLFPDDTTLHEAYLNLLRSLFSTSGSCHFVSGAYLTGELPMRHCGVFGYLADFQEFYLLDAGNHSDYFHRRVPLNFSVPEICPLLKRSLSQCTGETVDVLRTLINGQPAFLDRTRLPANFMTDSVHPQFMLSLLTDLGWLTFDRKTTQVSFADEIHRRSFLQLFQTIQRNQIPADGPTKNSL